MVKRMKRNVTGPFDPFPTMQVKVPCYCRCKQMTHILPPLVRTGETSGVSRSRTTTEAWTNSLEVPFLGKSNKTAPIPPKLPNPLYRQVFSRVVLQLTQNHEARHVVWAPSGAFSETLCLSSSILWFLGAPRHIFFYILIKAWQLELGFKTF